MKKVILVIQTFIGGKYMRKTMLLLKTFQKQLKNI